MMILQADQLMHSFMQQLRLLLPQLRVILRARSNIVVSQLVTSVEVE